MFDPDDLAKHRCCSRGHFEFAPPSLAHHGDLIAGGDIGWGGEAQLALILSGRNIGYLVCAVARPCVDRGLLRVLRVPSGSKSNPVSLISASQTSRSTIAKEFIRERRKVHLTEKA